MDLQHFLETFFKSNVLVIETLFGVVLAGVTFLTFKSFARPEESQANVDLHSIEEGIKKILENYSGPAQVAPSESPVPNAEAPNKEALEELSTQIERLKIQLIQKNEEIEQLKANPVSTPEGGENATGETANTQGSADVAVYEEKIKDLEAKLAEYAVIEDDIADLSHYKSENARLLAEVDQLKEKLARVEGNKDVAKVVPAPQPDSVTEATATPKASPSPIEMAQSSAAPVEAESASMQEDRAAEAATLSADDDIMAEFERAVAEQKAMTNGDSVVKTLPSGDIEPIVEPVQEGGIDLDKMINEVAALPEASDVDPEKMLSEAVDTDKLLQEADGMEKVDVDALSQFDQFLKKEGA